MISIHAPVKGATSHSHTGIRAITNFNPRTREGCDRIGQFIDIFKIISIHAPVKGATLDPRYPQRYTTISIHAPVKGATRVSGSHRPVITNFNPRTREGCDPRSLTVSIVGTDFNPRTREGCDVRDSSNRSPSSSFQSTHP